jgi:hypothetical protein
MEEWEVVAWVGTRILCLSMILYYITDNLSREGGNFATISGTAWKRRGRARDGGYRVADGLPLAGRKAGVVWNVAQNNIG